jgi:sugar phosphate isomerase/epimerase
MHNHISRRRFLKNAALASTGVAIAGASGASLPGLKPLFRLSVAEWSVHPLIFGDARKDGWEKFMQLLKNDFGAIEKAAPMTNIEFPQFIREVGCEGAEYVNTCMYDKAKNTKYLNELNNVCRGEGITNVLIMVDAEGMVGAPEKKDRLQTLENHKKWVDAAAQLGCHSIRVNAGSQGSYEEQQKLAADGLYHLCEYGDTAGINILVENHGGFSSNGKWLSQVMEMVDHSRIGTLPDFGNFRTSHEPEEWYDRYLGMKELMPYAKGVSAKSNEFDQNGEEIHSDYHRIMRIVMEAGYRGFVGIEYEGEQLSPREGVLATKRLLEKCHRELAKEFKA